MKFVEHNWSVSKGMPALQKKLVKAQLGDEKCLQELFEQYQPLVRHLWQKYYSADIEAEDWQQEALIVLFKVLRGYQDIDAAQFSSFYKQSLENRMLDFYRIRQARKRIPAKELAAMNDLMEEMLTHQNDSPLDEIAHCHACLTELLQNCSPFEREVLILINEGRPTREICLMLACKKRKVESAITRLRGKLVRILR